MAATAGINFCAVHIPYFKPYAKHHLNCYNIQRPITFNHYFPQPSLHLFSGFFPHVLSINMCDYFRSSVIAGQSNLTTFSPLFLNYTLLHLHHYIHRLIFKYKVTVLHMCVSVQWGMLCRGRRLLRLKYFI